MGDWMRVHRGEYPEDWAAISLRVRAAAGWQCTACGSTSRPGRILTVDHLNHHPPDVRNVNLMALCQRCHLMRQGLSPRPSSKAEARKRIRRRLAEIERKRRAAAAAPQLKMF